MTLTTRSARERLWEVLDVSLQDQRQAWQMDSTGNYVQLRPQDTATGPARTGTHQALMDLTRRRAAQSA